MKEFDTTIPKPEVPKRCLSCPRLGELAAQLAQANDDRDRTVSMINSDQAETLRLLATEKFNREFPEEKYPKMTKEMRKQQIDAIIAGIQANRASSENLVYAGRKLTEQDGRICDALEAVETMISICPPDGCVDR